jgi:hypothetical protein
MGELHQAEEENVHKATVKYFGKRLTKRSAPFDLSWLKKLHREMLGSGRESFVGPTSIRNTKSVIRSSPGRNACWMT